MTAPIVVVMGVSGCGKTVVGTCLAQRLACPFVDADDLHSRENIQKMASGIALSDADRAPWLDRVAETILEWRRAASGGVVACSALRRAYRDRLRQGGARPLFVHLTVDRAALWVRSENRRHFMPVSLIDSQLATLEPPDATEYAVSVPSGPSIERTCAKCFAKIRLRAQSCESK